MSPVEASIKLNQMEEISTADIKWIQSLNSKVLIFYAKPMLRKWQKIFPTPKTVIVSPTPVDETLWQKKLKCQSIDQWTAAEAEIQAEIHPESVDLLIVLTPRLSERKLVALLPLVKKSGATIWVSKNLDDTWNYWQHNFEQHQIADTYPVGFHPKGAVAWWPYNDRLTVVLGKIVDMIAPFFPGRYPMGLKFGQCWLVRGFKRYDKTEL